MSIEEYVEQSRYQLRKKFGKVEAKTDCAHYSLQSRKPYCRACCHYFGHYKCRLQCEVGVCYFYDKKE